MSDDIFQPIQLGDASTIQAAFQPRSFVPAQPNPETAPVDETVSGIPDPIVPAVDPYVRGYEEGYAYALNEYVAERRQLLDLLAAASALQNEPSEELASLIAETVERLVREIVEDAALDKDRLIRRARKAAKLIADCDAARTMWVNPQDIILLQEANIGLTICADPAAEQGSIRIDCSTGWIEHGTTLYLQQLRTELGLEEPKE